MPAPASTRPRPEIASPIFSATPGAGENERLIDIRAYRTGASTDPRGVSQATILLDLRDRFRAHGEAWKADFVNWLGNHNAANARLEWWAYATTAKNFLSSALGQRVLEVFAVVQAAKESSGALRVIGASPTQARAILLELGFDAPRTLRLTVQIWGVQFVAMLRVTFQFLRAFAAFQFVPRPKARGALDLCAVTYIDRPLEAKQDSYFGGLRDVLAERYGRTLTYVPYVYTPYLSRLRELRGSADAYDPLFFYLRVPDWIAAFGRSLAASIGRPGFVTRGPHAGLDLLLREALVEDVARRGYLFNLLVYAAMTRLVAERRPQAVLYPYENKSLEKMLLLACRASNRPVATVGYQHTSVTPRHTTLLFAAGEARVTPLPDRIITAGDISRAFLERWGRYPADIFVTGCALRQTWAGRDVRRRFSGKAVRVLLALSSSRAELVAGVRFAAELREHAPEVEIGVRPHPQFGLSLLPPDLARWLRDFAADLSGTSLSDNLDWCDIVAYASSTVALEALMRGKPVLHFDVQEVVSGDPLIGPDSGFRFEAGDASEGAAILGQLLQMTDEEYERRAQVAIEYVRAYLRPATAACAQLFLSVPTRQS